MQNRQGLKLKHLAIINLLGYSDNRVRNRMQSKTINCVIFNNSSLLWISQKCLKFEDIENKSGKIREKNWKGKRKRLPLHHYLSALPPGFCIPGIGH